MIDNLNIKAETVEVTENEDYGKFVISPLERGYATTLGNSLRRVLLSSLPGSAVTKIRIQGVQHEFSTIPGVIEDVPEIILNIKGIYLKSFKDVPIELSVDIKGPCTLTAGDLIKDSDIEVANPDHYIATLDEDANLSMDLVIANGSGYKVSDYNKSEDDPIGTIAIDSSYTPVLKVNYKSEYTRVAQVTDYDKLTLEVWTNGTISAKDAISEGVDMLTDYLQLLKDLPGSSKEEVQEEKNVDVEKGYSINIEDLDLSLRSFNCLKRANINTIGDITSKTKSEISKIKNFGKKSMDEIEQNLKDLNLSFKDEE